jgi:hypothetical protein
LPTVHLSLPDKVYRELKQKAAELGIQVTDLIKIFIREGLNNGIGSGIAANVSSPSKSLSLLENRMNRLEMKLEREILYMQGKLREYDEMFKYINERFDQLEEMLEKVVKQKQLLLAGSE